MPPPDPGRMLGAQAPPLSTTPRRQGTSLAKPTLHHPIAPHPHHDRRRVGKWSCRVCRPGAAIRMSGMKSNPSRFYWWCDLVGAVLGTIGGTTYVFAALNAGGESGGGSLTDPLTMTLPSNKRWRWNLRTLLLIFVPTCVALAYGTAEYRRVSRATNAWLLMVSKGVVSPNGSLVDGVFHFENGAVSDSDLLSFIPACDGPLPNGLGRIRVLDLNGSNVNDEAIGRFESIVPACEIRR